MANGDVVPGDERHPLRTLGAEIRALRKTQNMTLEQLAEACGLSSGFLSLVERDRKRPSLATLQRISAAFGVEIGWFFRPYFSDDPLERAYVVRKDFVSFNALFAMNAVAFLISASLVFAVALPRPKPTTQERGVIARTTFGIRAYLATPRLRGLLEETVAWLSAPAGRLGGPPAPVCARVAGQDR